MWYTAHPEEEPVRGLRTFSQTSVSEAFSLSRSNPTHRTHAHTHTQSRQPQGWGGVCEPAVEEDRVSLSHCVCLVLVLTVPLYTCVRQRVLLLSQSVAGTSTHVDTRSSLFFSSSPIGFLTNLELISRNNSPLRVGVCWRRLWRLVGFLVRRRLHAKAERGVYHAVRGVVVVVVVERYR